MHLQRTKILMLERLYKYYCIYTRWILVRIYFFIILIFNFKKRMLKKIKTYRLCVLWNKNAKKYLIRQVKMIFINACSFNLFVLSFMNEPPLALRAKPSSLLENLLFFYKMLSHSFYLKLSNSLIKILHLLKLKHFPPNSS